MHVNRICDLFNRCLNIFFSFSVFLFFYIYCSKGVDFYVSRNIDPQWSLKLRLSFDADVTPDTHINLLTCYMDTLYGNVRTCYMDMGKAIPIHHEVKGRLRERLREMRHFGIFICIFPYSGVELCNYFFVCLFFHS